MHKLTSLYVMCSDEVSVSGGLDKQALWCSMIEQSWVHQCDTATNPPDQGHQDSLFATCTLDPRYASMARLVTGVTGRYKLSHIYLSMSAIAAVQLPWQSSTEVMMPPVNEKEWCITNY
jgi:hypothetical protein